MNMNKNRKTLLGLILVALVVVGYFAWEGTQQNRVVSRNNEMTKIGVILPLTGVVAEPGGNALKGIQLAIDGYNFSTQEKQITLIVEDSKSDPKIGVSAINKLIYNDKCEIIIGDVMSSVFLACAPVAEANKVVMISPGASAPTISEAGDYIFRNYLSDDFDGRIMANYISKKTDKKKIGVISVNNDYGNGVVNSFSNALFELGGAIVFSEKYSEGQLDFRSFLSKIKRKDFDALYLVCTPPESSPLVRQIREQNINVRLFGNLTFESAEFVNNSKGTFNEITFSAPPFDMKNSSEISKQFRKAFQQRYHMNPDLASGLGYDTALILIQALKSVNFLTSNLKEALYKTSFRGVTGEISFDNKGDVVKDIQIKKITSSGDIEVIELFSLKK